MLWILIAVTCQMLTLLTCVLLGLKQWPSMYQHWGKSWQLKYFCVCLWHCGGQETGQDDQRDSHVGAGAVERSRAGAVCHQCHWSELIRTKGDIPTHKLSNECWQLMANEQNCEHDITLASTADDEISSPSMVKYLQGAAVVLTLFYEVKFPFSRL